MSLKLAVVTATLDPIRAGACINSWELGVEYDRLYEVRQGTEGYPAWAGGKLVKTYHTPEILGVVPAFALGVQQALTDGYELIACLHDDLEIPHGERWGARVKRVFLDHPSVGLVGFGGGTRLGASDIYQTPYHPMQLARQDFVSNMVDAEAHGRRGTQPEVVACLDGFSQIGRREFWLGLVVEGIRFPVDLKGRNLFTQMQEWNVVHHFYDGMLGCFARRLGWEVWMLPVACRHFGGQTAVGDARYAEWATLEAGRRGSAYEPHMPLHDGQGGTPTGDQRFWAEAHWIGYNQFRDVLPIRTRR